MKLLMLGGTVFLGRHIVASARAAGHRVTLFHRGKHAQGLFPEAEELIGDRDGQLSALSGQKWDAAIDTSGYVPRIVRASAELLADAVQQYTFISSISVYPEIHALQLDESSPVSELEDPTVETITGETYGPLKAACEQAAQAVFPQRALIVRPGLIVGPHDPSDRFTYWPHRIARGGDVLAPGRPEREIQFIDVRDLADWIVRMVETRQTGVYNTTGPARPLTMLAFLEACRQVAGSAAHFTWVDEDFLAREKVQPYMELPLWIPSAHDTVNCARARAAALSHRLLEETIADTLRWDHTRPAGHPWRAGLPAKRETQLLSRWRQLAEVG